MFPRKQQQGARDVHIVAQLVPSNLHVRHSLSATMPHSGLPMPPPMSNMVDTYAAEAGSSPRLSCR